MKKSTLALLAVLSLCALPAFAQDKPAAAASPPAAAAAEAAPAATPDAATAEETMPDPTKAPDWPQRLELAKKMSQIQPASQQIGQAVEQLSLSLPPPQRAAFKANIVAAIDEKKLEQVSVDAMARTFTVAELQRMVDYFGTPEARSIARKMPIYQQLVQPEIIRMMDAAEMKAHTGAAGDPSPPAQNPAAGTPSAATPPVGAKTP